MGRWAVLVIWSSGDEQYLMSGNAVAVFPNKARAEQQAEFLRMGMEDEASINVVRAPTSAARRQVGRE